MTARAAFESLNRALGLAPLRVPSFTHDDPIIPTRFRAGRAAAVSLGLAASAANEIWRLRGGNQQDIEVDLNLAASSLLSFALLRLDGKPVPRPGETNPTIGLYRAADSRWIHLHGGFPFLAQRTLDLLNCADSAEDIAASVAKWSSFALEDALAFMGLCGAVARSEEEWRSTAQGLALANVPPVSIRRIGDAPPLKLDAGRDPLSGIRVLDLTRVLAGPSAGRTLAAHGADVLSIRCERLPTIDVFDLDTGLGKRALYLDLVKPGDAEQLRQLARNAHIFVDSYRPGALAKLGFSPSALAHSNPGMIYVSVSCYGHSGPWAQRRGWEQLAQTATGIAVEQGGAQPQLIPAAVCDYVTGYLTAAGACAALIKRMREGGSWLVETSLCATATWLQSLGRVEGTLPETWNPAAGLDGEMRSCETGRGRLDFLGPVVRMSETPPAWRRPPPVMGVGEATWLAA